MMFLDKIETRTFIKSELKKKSEEEMALKSASICKKLLSNENFINAPSLAFFLPLKTEVNILPILEACLNQNKNCYIPLVTDKENGTMDFFKSEKKLPLNEQLKPGAFGILEPCITLPKMQEPEVFMLVPGMAFDTLFNRLGKGKGFYDRFFEKYNGNITKAGICFDFQLLEKIPSDTHDIKMDFIFTDSRILINR